MFSHLFNVGLSTLVRFQPWALNVHKQVPRHFTRWNNSLQNSVIHIGTWLFERLFPGGKRADRPLALT